MANITAKTEDTSPTSSDLLYEVDVSDTTDNANGSDKKVTAANLITKAHGLSDGVVKVASGAMTSATAGTDYYAPGGTDVALADGGTGASTASTARTNLGLDPHATYKSKTDGTTAPTSTDDSSAGYSVGSLWVDVTNDKSYICVDSTASNAVWNDLTASAGGGISNVVEDTTPQLGGDLDAQTNSITNLTNINGVAAPTAQYTTAEETKLANIETAADVTDAANVQTALGSLDVADIGDVTITTIASGEILKWNGTGWINNTLAEADIQDIPAEGAFVDGDKTKLDGIETGADVTDTTNVTSALASITIDAHSGVDTDKSKTPADGDVLTFDGTDWNAETPAAGGGGANPYGADLVVAASGGDYTTLGAALAAASANDVIYVEPGTYTETTQTVATTGIKVFGASPTATTIALSTVTWTLSGNNMMFENIGFTISTGQLAMTGTNQRMVNCKMVASSHTSASTGHINLTGNGSIIDKLEYHNSDTSTASNKEGIRVAGIGATISNCQIFGSTDGTGTSIVQLSGACKFVNNHVAPYNYNSASEGAGRALDVASNRVRVADNVFTNFSSATAVVILCTDRYNVISNNSVQGGAIGIQGPSNGHTIISNNTILHAGQSSGAGIKLTGSYSRAHGNYIQGPYAGTNYGVWVASAVDSCQVSDNNIVFCHTGIYVEASSCDNNLISNNLCMENTSAQITDNGTGTVSDNNITS